MHARDVKRKSMHLKIYIIKTVIIIVYLMISFRSKVATPITVSAPP